MQAWEKSLLWLSKKKLFVAGADWKRNSYLLSSVFSKDCDVTTVFTCLMYMYYFHVNSCTSWCAYFLSYFIIKKNVIHVQQNFRKNKNN